MPTSLPQQYYSKLKARAIGQSIVGSLCLAGGGFMTLDIVLNFIESYEKSGLKWDQLSAPPAFLISMYSVYVGGYYLYEGVQKIKNSKNDFG